MSARENLPESVSAMLADYMSRVVPESASKSSREIIANAYVAGVSGGLALMAMSDDDFETTMNRLATELEAYVAEKH